MKLIEARPNHPSVCELIDKYQYFDIEKTTYLKSVPNGKIESWIINEGSCQLWNSKLGEFENSKPNGFYPASNACAHFKILGNSKCLNIKWNLGALALPFFKSFLNEWSEFELEEFIGKQHFDELRQISLKPDQHLVVERLDKIFAQAITKYQLDHQVNQLFSLIESSFPNGFKVPDLAAHLCVSPKTLERKIKRQLGLYPKELSNIMRFSNTTKYHLEQQKARFLTDSIKFGYFDQSHFIKECKRYTGYTPSKFFLKLKLSTNDLIVENDY